MARRVATSVALAVVLSAFVAPVARAECMDWPVEAAERLRIRYAFTATVADVSRLTELTTPDAPGLDWRAELDVQRTFRGRVPDVIVANGWDVGCHFFRADRLQKGDRIFVASSAFRLNDELLDPFSVMDAQVIVWKRAGGRWRLYEEVLDYGSDRKFYPGAARAASSTADILRLISSASPDTSTTLESGPRVDIGTIAVLILTFAGGFALALRPRAPRTRAPRT